MLQGIGQHMHQGGSQGIHIKAQGINAAQRSKLFGQLSGKVRREDSTCHRSTQRGADFAEEVRSAGGNAHHGSRKLVLHDKHQHFEAQAHAEAHNGKVNAGEYYRGVGRQRGDEQRAHRGNDEAHRHKSLVAPAFADQHTRNKRCHQVGNAHWHFHIACRRSAHAMGNLEVGRQIRHSGHGGEQNDEATYCGKHEIAVLEQEQRHKRMLRTILCYSEQYRKHNRRHNKGDDHRAVPCIFNPTPGSCQRKCAHCCRNERHAPEVKVLQRFALAIGRQQHHGHGNGHNGKRDVDPERPAPTYQVGEHATQERSYQHGQRPADAHDVQVQCAFAGRNDIGNDGLRQHHRAASAQTGHSAPGNKQAHVGCRTAHNRTNQEQYLRQDEQPFSANHIAHFAINGHGDGTRQNICGSYPQKMAHTT